MTKEEFKTLVLLDTSWDQDLLLTLLPAGGQITAAHSISVGIGDIPVLAEFVSGDEDGAHLDGAIIYKVDGDVDQEFLDGITEAIKHAREVARTWTRNEAQPANDDDEMPF